MSLRSIAIACATAALGAACAASHVVDGRARAVAPPDTRLEWRPTCREDLRGLFESVSIDGEAGASLWKIYYAFDESGVYSGAALVLGDGAPQFQTLSGHWTLAGDVLDLGEGQLARVSSAPDHLRLQHDQGVAILRRVAVP